MTPNWKQDLGQQGVQAALGAAFLFGGGTPPAKWLLSGVNPWLLAGLLYLGSGASLSLCRLARKTPPAKLPAGEWPWLAGAILAGTLRAARCRANRLSCRFVPQARGEDHMIGFLLEWSLQNRLFVLLARPGGVCLGNRRAPGDEGP
jgi:hypothetical protein